MTESGFTLAFGAGLVGESLRLTRSRRERLGVLAVAAALGGRALRELASPAGDTTGLLGQIPAAFLAGGAVPKPVATSAASSDPGAADSGDTSEEIDHVRSSA